MGDAIYDKQEAESAKAYAAFAAYRDLGPSRTVDAAYQKLRQNSGKTPAKRAESYFWAWVSEFDWKKRAEAFDADQDKKRREEAAEHYRLELESYRQEMLIRVRGTYQRSFELLEAAKSKLAEPKIVSEMSPRDAALFIRVGVNAMEQAARMEGIALGILGENGEFLEAADK